MKQSVYEILVVDDEPDIRAILAFSLETAGFVVREAANGAEALAAIQGAPPACLVLDLLMPGVDGFSVLRTRRQQGLAPEMRVLVLTAKTAERDYLRAFELGADEYLTKPFDPDVLVDRVRELLRSSPASLQRRREAELAKAELLDRLESAFLRPRPPSA
jgi:DNA-binding response OmpR family regulator